MFVHFSDLDLAQLFEDDIKLHLGLLNVHFDVFLDFKVWGHFFFASCLLVLRHQFLYPFIDRLVLFGLQADVLLKSVSDVFKLYLNHVDTLHL